jgi:uncharacterized membrane protein
VSFFQPELETNSKFSDETTYALRYLLAKDRAEFLIYLSLNFNCASLRTGKLLVKYLVNLLFNYLVFS